MSTFSHSVYETKEGMYRNIKEMIRCTQYSSSSCQRIFLVINFLDIFIFSVEITSLCDGVCRACTLWYIFEKGTFYINVHSFYGTLH